MPLDTGGEADLDLAGKKPKDPKRVESYAPTLESGESIGAALKSIREFRGVSLEEIAAATCVRRAYLAAIEDMRLEALPSRPFTIGYIRAYADALGLEGDAAVARFRRDEPPPDDGLREPVGVTRGRDPRLAMFAAAGAVVVGAILIWNIAQRAVAENAPPADAQTVSVASPAPVSAVGGALSLGGPLPAPVESTTPTPYETPGLAAATAAREGLVVDPAAPAAKTVVSTAPVIDLPTQFKAAGPVYGAPPEASVITLQARKSASIIVRGQDGSVYFARQLAAGEAYRAPSLQGLIIDVSDPAAFQVFVGGQTRGLMPATQVPVSKLQS